MEMRVRLKELLKERDMTLYQLAQAVEQRGVSVQAVYRLGRYEGQPQRLDVRLLAALCEVLAITDLNELLTLKPVGTYATYKAPRAAKRS